MLRHHPCSADGSRFTWYRSPARHSTLLSRLEATTECLNYILSLSSAEVLSLTTPGLLRLLYAVLILAMFYTGPDAPLLDAKFLRRKARLGHYMRALVEKFRNIVAELNKSPGQCLLFVSRMFEDSKTWCGSAIASATAINDDLFESFPLRVPKRAPTVAAEPCVNYP